MRYRQILGVFGLLFLGLWVVQTSAQTSGAPVRQWAVSAKATSEYSPTSWNASQATGEPIDFACGDLPTAWASATANREERINLLYRQPVFATEVNIYQNLARGAIVQVGLNLEDGTEFIVPNSADNGTECGVFNLLVPVQQQRVSGVTIYLDERLVGNWNEIDAVELVGYDNVQDARLNQGRSTFVDNTPTGSNLQPPSSNNPTNTFTGPLGVTVTCDSGGTFTNGVEITAVQLRSGFNYRATAIGLNGFDPVLAVLGEDGDGLCEDDDANAATYSANLPTTGQVSTSGLSSQVPFSNTSASAFADISLVVGGFNDQNGEFLLIFEGMTLSTADGSGDPFSLLITPGIIQSGVPPTAYVISVTNAFDPVLSLIDGDYNVMSDRDGLITCDDAGNPGLCWNTQFDLRNSYVSRSQNRQLPGGSLDSMLSVPVTTDSAGNYLNFLVSSAVNTYGDYIMVFHVATGAP